MTNAVKINCKNVLVEKYTMLFTVSYVYSFSIHFCMENINTFKISNFLQNYTGDKFKKDRISISFFFTLYVTVITFLTLNYEVCDVFIF